MMQTTRLDYPPRFYLVQLVLLALSAVVLAWVFHATRLDLQLEVPYYDQPNDTFPIRYAWAAKYLVHRYLKYTQIAAGIVVWIVALRARHATGASFLATHRKRWWVVATSFVAVPITIGILHRLSPMHCPWDVAEFGGDAPYFDLFTAPPPGISRGHCFPAAFVSSGSWMLAFALLWYPERKRRCVVVGLLALAWGFGLGWLQQMRGAHFLSHTLWSLWVSWAVVLIVHYALGAWRERSP